MTDPHPAIVLIDEIIDQLSGGTDPVKIVERLKVDLRPLVEALAALDPRE